ncbi:phage portal protein [Thalassobacillus sp. CUG 92003]|uniref:phage portal protein n=1 Tax=Thalassobacillus sp. CUG 92003 TaxID=2736641 RepID=UPI0015E7E1E4|nr:phage portal protein [Thalassobacillus sp. CUG 92003]
MADYNLLAPETMDDLLFDAFDQSLGSETRERLRTQFENYEYYDGKQHVDPKTGRLVKATELERPAGLDYDPTRYATNYFKAIIDRKARWQMGGKHGIQVPRKDVDSQEARLAEGYTPSPEQKRVDNQADAYERLLYRLWDENKMRSKLIQAARDRLIADRVVCKIVFNQRTGKLRWIWRPDTEFIPVFSDDDFEDLIAAHFVRQKIVEAPDGEEIRAIQKQTFRIEEDGGCYLEEGVYRQDDLELLEEITPYSPMGIDFIPVVTFPVNDLLGEETGEGEISDLREQNDVLNQMNEDAIDSMKFEMFSMTAVLNAPEGTADKMEVAPGSVLEATGNYEGQSPDIKKVESSFRWKDAFKDQYARVKGAMHEVSGLPQIVPQELNFGGLNGEALQVLFHDIITDTEEHWHVWGYQLSELHEKSVRYLQARTAENNFAYDKTEVSSITDYTNEMKFVLPLPDNRKELVELLGEEIGMGLESQAGGMQRAGVDNVQAKKAEIEQERMQDRASGDPYGNQGGSPSKTSGSSSETTEQEKICPECGGSGTVYSDNQGREVTCNTCKGDGIVQTA